MLTAIHQPGLHNGLLACKMPAAPMVRWLKVKDKAGGFSFFAVQFCGVVPDG